MKIVHYVCIEIYDIIARGRDNTRRRKFVQGWSYIYTLDQYLNSVAWRWMVLTDKVWFTKKHLGRSWPGN